MVGSCFIQGPSTDMNVVDPSYSSVRYLVTLFSQSRSASASAVKTCSDSRNNSNATTVLFDSEGIYTHIETCFASFIPLPDIPQVSLYVSCLVEIFIN